MDSMPTPTRSLSSILFISLLSSSRSRAPRARASSRAFLAASSSAAHSLLGSASTDSLLHSLLQQPLHFHRRIAAVAGNRAAGASFEMRISSALGMSWAISGKSSSCPSRRRASFHPPRQMIFSIMSLTCCSDVSFSMETPARRMTDTSTPSAPSMPML
eukprot:6197331-Pleurochrysis_carterae.AAC.4